MVTATTATVAGKSMTILVDAAKNLTLYYLTTDKAGTVTCTGTCLTSWPLLEMPDPATPPTGGAGVTGKLATVTDPNGKAQVTYHGWPLYFFIKDKVPGDTTGRAWPASSSSSRRTSRPPRLVPIPTP